MDNASHRDREFYLRALEIPVWRERRNLVATASALSTATGLASDAHSKATATSSASDSSHKIDFDDPIADPAVVPAASWPAFENKVRQCQQCPLHCTRQHAVVGDGPYQVDLCIIGEAPGAEEDKQGKPFVGRAGQLLTEMIQAIGLDRKSVYITNILKCRPPGNRDPRPEEIAECTPYLLQQLAWLQPKVILLLGRIAAQTLLETTLPMRSLRQKQYTYSAANYPVVVTYHPAYLLRNPADKAKALEDLLRLKVQLQTIR